ncbi:MAG: HupE/UreJ family protein [Sphingomonadaceae bacterium]|nr:HupE/UreJ family protein [Sphingomonadaceae bacterium]
MLLVAILTVCAVSVRADDLRPAYLEIREVIGPDPELRAYAVTWKAPIKPGLAARVNPAFPSDCKAGDVVRRGIDSGALLSTWTIACDMSLKGRKVGLDGIGETSGDALMRFHALDGQTQASRLTPHNPAATIAATPERGQVARTYFVIGIEHIVTGYDHLLFVLCLVMLLNGAWRVAATVTAFTVAHSLTLIATTLELLSVPRAPVEALIALSIVFLAVEIVKRDPSKPRLAERVPWLVAFLFGILHGFGFASALAEIGLPHGEVPTALLTFNLGVEAGQLFVVAIAMLAFWVLRKLRAQAVAPAQAITAYAIGSIAALWLLERTIFG